MRFEGEKDYISVFIKLYNISFLRENKSIINMLDVENLFAVESFTFD